MSDTCSLIERLVVDDVVFTPHSGLGELGVYGLGGIGK